MKINRGKIVLILVLMSISISILIYSFAYTTTTHTGEESSYLTVSKIAFGLTDSVESINLGQQTPTIDKFGLLNEPFSFSIQNTSSEEMQYTVRLIDKTVSTISNGDIRYQITRNGVVGDVKYLNESGTIDSGIIASGGVINYSIIIWLKYDAVSLGGTWEKVVKVEAGTVNIDNSGANEPILLDNMIPVYYDNENAVWRKADQTNSNIDYQWYDYDGRMWANSVITNKDASVVLDNMAADLSGNKHHGNYYGNPVKNVDNIAMDGVDDYVNTGLVYDFRNAASIAVKVKLNNLATHQGLIGNWESGGLGLEIYGLNGVYYLQFAY